MVHYSDEVNTERHKNTQVQFDTHAHLLVQAVVTCKSHRPFLTGRMVLTFCLFTLFREKAEFQGHDKDNWPKLFVWLEGFVISSMTILQPPCFS